MPRRPTPASPNGQPLLLGRLAPDMTITAWCAHCGQDHVHSWNPMSGLTGVSDRMPHCAGTTIETPSYWVALDPTHDAESRRILSRLGIVAI